MNDDYEVTVSRGNTPEDREGLLRAIALAEANQRGDHLGMAALVPQLDDEAVGLVNGFLALLDTLADADRDGFAVMLDAVRMANVPD